MDELRSESVAPDEPLRRRPTPRATPAAARERALSALARLKPARAPRPLAAEPSWTFPELAGRLVEIHGEHGGVLSLAARLVHDAQRRGETAAWVLARDTSFFPPDLADGGIDLEGLVVVRTSVPGGGARAADLLVRSGAFGLVVLELGVGRRSTPNPDGELERAAHPRRVSLRVPNHDGARRVVDEVSRDDDVPLALQSRLLAAAQAHDAIVLCVSTKPRGSSSLGSLVSLFGEVELSRAGPERSLASPGLAPSSAAAEGSDTAGFVCTLHVKKDKRRAPGWRHVEVCRGPLGLR